MTEIHHDDTEAALARDEALIQIDGTGLAPQLEAFMWEILNMIRANYVAST